MSAPWLETEVPQRPRFGRDRVQSRHEADIGNRSFVTHNVTLPPSIDALREVYSLWMLAASDKAGFAERKLRNIDAAKILLTPA